ncbi:MAG: hypothetical protein Q8M22_18225 [Actinomycetota bacterium]|nr:hypothetical protein [Actinomycetota bacterium]
MTALTAGRPLEPPHHPVGHRSITLVDHDRAGRSLGVEIWYPAMASDAPKTVYELFPGVAFSAATAQQAAPGHPGQYPLILFSHGRTGMRISYSMVCEALAARGAIVVSPDHPGDALFDWMLGQHADDRTNEVNRVADAHFVLRAMLHGADEVPVELLNAVHHEQVALAGHSYGAYTAYATAAGSRGVAAHAQVRAVLGFQAYTRTMSDTLLSRVSVPSLLVVSELDQVTPPDVDADRPWALLAGRPLWRLDLAGASHQAISDIALYAELAAHVPELPQLVRDYLTTTAAGTASAAGRSWRELMQLQVSAAWAFLQVVLGLDPEAGDETALSFDDIAGVRLRRH